MKFINVHNFEVSIDRTNLKYTQELINSALIINKILNGDDMTLKK